MAVCSCSSCGQFFVIGAAPDAGAQPCRTCGEPLHPVSRAEAQAHVRAAKTLLPKLPLELRARTG